MPSISNIGAIPPQTQPAAIGKVLDAQKQAGQAALKLIDAATQVAKTAQTNGPKATGNNIDITV